MNDKFVEVLIDMVRDIGKNVYDMQACDELELAKSYARIIEVDINKLIELLEATK